jgi:molybdopterin-containing oxidoreductase family membrane subunit
VFTVVSLAVLIAGIGAFIYESREGMIVTGMGNIGSQGGATWGLYVVMAEFFIGVSLAGIVLVSFAKVFDIRALRPISRLAVLLTTCSLIVGVFAVVMDLGNPLRGIINMFLYIRPQSAFFGTFMLVAVGVLLTSLVYLYLDGRRDAGYLADIDSRLRWFHRLWAAGYKDTDIEQQRHRRVMFWLSIMVVPLVLIATVHRRPRLWCPGRPAWLVRVSSRPRLHRACGCIGAREPDHSHRDRAEGSCERKRAGWRDRVQVDGWLAAGRVRRSAVLPDR